MAHPPHFPPSLGTRTASSPAPGPGTEPRSERQRVLRASDLLGGNAWVEIEHLGQRYRLQATRAGKLILTK